MQVGNFTLDVWDSAYPVWIIVERDGARMQFSHEEIEDLEYLVRVAKRRAYLALPKSRRAEVSNLKEGA